MTNKREQKAQDTDKELIADIDDRPQVVTESYGTGVKEQPGMNIGVGRNLEDAIDLYHGATNPELTGGDIDAGWEQAYMVGDEAVGGTVATPDQDIVDDLGVAVGLEMPDRHSLRTDDILNSRDNARWELDPECSEDFMERGDFDYDEED